MPLFDFRCDACGRQSELLVRGNTPPACPACGSTALTRLDTYSFAVKSGPGLSPAARRAVQRQQARQKADQSAFQQEIERKHLDDD